MPSTSKFNPGPTELLGRFGKYAILVRQLVPAAELRDHSGAEMGEIGVHRARPVGRGAPPPGHDRPGRGPCDSIKEAPLRIEREIRIVRWQQRRFGNLRPGTAKTPDCELTLNNGKVIAIEFNLTRKRSKDFERMLRGYRQERFDTVCWYVIAGAVPRVKQPVKDNRCDGFIEMRPWTDC